MKILKLNDPQVTALALRVLGDGGLVICPTETVYGALVDSTNSAAVAKLLTYKRRPIGKPFSIACADKKMAEKYVSLSSQAEKIYATLLPGPVTVISESRNQVATGVASEKNTLGIRLPAYPFLLKLVQQFGKPVTATSANSSGKKAPYSIPDLLDNLSPKQKSQIGLIIDANTLPKNPPSIVIDTTTSSPTVLRANKNINFQVETRENRAKVAYQREFCTKSETETRQLASKILADNLPLLQNTGLVITLDGPLGAGKTTFTQGLAQALQLNAKITSPTYTYLKEYPFSQQNLVGTLYHFDVWTIDQPATFKVLEIEKLIRPNNLILIEWFANIKDFFTPTIPFLQLTFQPTADDQKRQITLEKITP